VQELGGSIPRQTAKLANGNIPYHRCHAQFIGGGLAEGQESPLSLFCEFKSSLVLEVVGLVVLVVLVFPVLSC